MDNDTHPLVGAVQINAARRVIEPHLRRTPVARSTYLGEIADVELFFKLEMFQITGSFKPRGVLNKMHSLSPDERAAGVISLSAGNHAQALAYAAASEGIAATIVMPANAVASKIAATREHGGEVVLTDGDLLATTLSLQEERGMTMVHPFDDLNTIAGTGTLGMEVLEDVPEIDTVIVGIGGGGLISGVAAAIKTSHSPVKVIGVEPEGALGMTLALREGQPVHLEAVGTVADGLAAPFVGQHNLNHVQAFVDGVVTVNDEEIVRAMKLILERGKVLAEPAAASTYAALLSDKVVTRQGETVVCVLSGGNIDAARLVELLGD
ncbi:MAG: pyridoxal-phosphate dependent enzyme [SAR202 cluster bacterium]|jgi:threonine dehydratase|nr:pyridoxal-5'-phosphate-dependent protein beta subunit [Chloroflexota bacterium]MDP6421268.1 threonine/serine dehydratase [SAR202 cluster bacterium]MDP6664833.1 threonine/serine dehydratase [SAR202 cluster bacterium]MDP6801366.1 threonine/serine dehydratase [SAR202 cluster bacterium]MQG59519.1 pyridoxal-phosphate dependent enzyme [SAR202 cluster bacterium]|tara:strand:+ start:3158 stop:4126 length:969 start_codon:yes stop_codon:yes gene_type:complete